MIKQAYAIKRKNIISIDKTSTAGVATYLAEKCILEGGIVYGTVLASNQEVKFLRIDTITYIEKLKGSKYCQSNLNNTFQDVLVDLEMGKKVLFCGTPCQVKGLKKFLQLKKADTDNIFFIDLICHGVASPRFFSRWIKYCEQTNSSLIDELTFRDKRYGWKSQIWTTKYKNGVEEVETDKQQVFKNLYYGGYILRPSCHSCKFTNKDRTGDITLGDFWNILDVDASFMSEAGVGLMFINSEKGESLLQLCKSHYEIEAVDSDLCRQPQLEHPPVPNSGRSIFWKDFQMLPFSKIVRKYSGLSLKNRLMRKIKSILQRR